MTTNGNLPPGWRQVKLGDALASFQPGFACGKRDAAGVVQLRMNNIATDGRFNWSQVVRVPPNYTDMSKYWLQKCDVLFNNTNSAELVGKSAMFDAFSERLVYSNHFTCLRPNMEILDADYLAKWLLNQWNGGLFNRICNRWVGQAAVPREKLLALEIPLPSLDEQKRIVARLNEQMAVAEKARKAAEELLDAACALPNAFLREALPLEGQRLPRGWRWVPLGHLAAINPRRPPNIPCSLDTPTTFVPMTSVKENAGGIERLELRPFAQVSKGYTYFEDGDVLFAKITPCMQNGKHAVARNLNSGFGFGTTEFHVIRPGNTVLPEWVLSRIRQPSVLRQAAGQFRGAVGQQRVPKEFLSNLPIPLPRLSEQKHILGRLREQMAAAERARRAADTALEDLRAIPSALLRRALAGAF